MWQFKKKNLDRDIKNTHFNVRSWYCGCNHDSSPGEFTAAYFHIAVGENWKHWQVPMQVQSSFPVMAQSWEFLKVLTWVVHKKHKMWCEIYKKCKLNKFCIDGAFYLPCGLHVLGVMKTAADVLRFLCSKDKG